MHQYIIIQQTQYNLKQWTMQDSVACIHHSRGTGSTYACKSWVSWTTHSSINNQPAAFWKGHFLEGGMEESLLSHPGTQWLTAAGLEGVGLNLSLGHFGRRYCNTQAFPPGYFPHSFQEKLEGRIPHMIQCQHDIYHWYPKNKMVDISSADSVLCLQFVHLLPSPSPLPPPSPLLLPPFTPTHSKVLYEILSRLQLS